MPSPLQNPDFWNTLRATSRRVPKRVLGIRQNQMFVEAGGRAAQAPGATSPLAAPIAFTRSAVHWDESFGWRPRAALVTSLRAFVRRRSVLLARRFAFLAL